MARTIMEKHGYNEKQTATLLGLSQSAISRYAGRERGTNLIAIENTPEILARIDQMVQSLIKEPQNKTKVLELFCEICTITREKGLMCPKCEKHRPKNWTEKCFFCR
jgi:predicted transcriptional regulator